MLCDVTTILMADLREFSYTYFYRVLCLVLHALH